ncbi:MAG: hypothetical protein NTW87_16000 [Planctomycetota bacterium]|nr:hypothetical protein [Planctomycetota bacterium]
MKPVEAHVTVAAATISNVTVAAATISNEKVEIQSRKTEDKTKKPGTENPKPEPKARKPVEDPNKPADVVDLANLDLTAPPKTANPHSSDAKPPAPDVKGPAAVAPVGKKAEERSQKTEVRSPKPEEKGPKTEAKTQTTEAKSPKAEDKGPKTEPKDQKPVETAEAQRPAEQPKAAPKKTEAKPPPPKRVLPPVPDDFDQALSAGKRAMAEGVRLMALNTPESKQQAACSFEEAEAMLQGAWARKSGDDTVMAAFKDLCKHVGVIGIVRNPFIKSKVRGLVVLNAEPSFSSGGKKLYYSWQQKAGEELNLRPEDMFQKVVGVRIYKPGVYKFELAVSDGGLGSSPVTVTVEVTE